MAKLNLEYFEEQNRKCDDIVQPIVVASALGRVEFDPWSVLAECDMCPTVVWVRPESVERIQEGAILLCVLCAKRVRSITPIEKWVNATPNSVSPAAVDLMGVSNDPNLN